MNFQAPSLFLAALNMVRVSEKKNEARFLAGPTGIGSGGEVRLAHELLLLLDRARVVEVHAGHAAAETLDDLAIGVRRGAGRGDLHFHPPPTSTYLA